MASEGPVMNGDISRSAGQTGALEDTLRQMNILIQENRDLKEALHKANMTMKERFEGLAAWKEKQKEDRNFLDSKLSEAKVQIESLTTENQELRKKLGNQGGDTQGSEVEVLRAQLARLQAEKNDLVALNSELQLKADHSPNDDDSFIEIIKVTDGGENGVSSVCGTEHVKGPRCPSVNLSMSASRLDSEELTVSQLLQSLRNETQRAERLQEDLLQSKLNNVKLHNMLKELENQKSDNEQSTQTTEAEETKQQAAMAASEVENLKSQMLTLYKELQQAQSKLDEAEGMKKNLTDRCREVEQDVATLKAQLVDRQTVQSENDRLKLQLDSMQAQSLVEQRKVGEEKNNFAQLKEAYTKLFEDYNEMKEEEKKKRESQLAQRGVVDDLEERLTAAEKALVAKQEQIDEMKQEIYAKEKELETINLFKLQAEVYSSDFHAEREAREKIHEEKERLAAQLEFVKKQNSQLQDEMESLGRHSLNELQRRHVGGNQPSLVGRGAEWQQGSIPEHACPKCNEILPDLDSLQIHIMDCIN